MQKISSIIKCSVFGGLVTICGICLANQQELQWMTPLNGKITKADAIERCAASKARLPTAAELNDARQDMVDAGYKNTRFWTQETGNPHTNKNRKTKLAVFYSDKELAKQAAEQAVRDAEKAKETLPQLICVR